LPIPINEFPKKISLTLVAVAGATAFHKKALVHLSVLYNIPVNALLSENFLKNF